MTTLISGLILFLGVHSISIVSASARDRGIAAVGAAVWRAGYALLAVVGLVLIVRGYGIARQAPILLYAPPAWLRDIAVLLLAAVFPLLLAAYLPGRIKARLKHPMLIATKLWATAHLLANGTLADVVLFGSLLVWGGALRVSLKRRAPRPLSTLPVSRWNDAIAVAGGLALYTAFVSGLHTALIGVPAVFPWL